MEYKGNAVRALFPETTTMSELGSVRHLPIFNILYIANAILNKQPQLHYKQTYIRKQN